MTLLSVYSLGNTHLDNMKAMCPCPESNTSSIKDNLLDTYLTT